MDTVRKQLILSGHAEKQSGKGRGNLLKSSAIKKEYEIGAQFQDFVADTKASFGNRIFGRHSDQARTRRTIVALYAGMTDTHVECRTHETNLGLDEMPGVTKDMKEDPRLSETGLKFNFDSYIEQGHEVYMDRWFANQEAITLDGVAITPFRDLIRRSGNCLFDNLKYLLNNPIEQKRLGILCSHRGIVDATFTAAFNATSKRPAWRIQDINGHFEQGEYAVIDVDYKPKSGNASQAILTRGTETHPLSLETLSKRYCPDVR